VILNELRVRELGVIEDLTLVLHPGMTALTGETGAGKTLVVEAIELLVGGRADSVLVRPGAVEAVIEGRFVDDEEEVVLARTVPASGRSRAHLDGRMVPVGGLAEAGGALVDLHGQHAHQSLLTASTQRAALDQFGAIDHGPLLAARSQLAVVDEGLAGLGGDERSRARELDLLRFQVNELDAAKIEDPEEDESLRAEEDELADASAHREAAAAAHDALVAEGGGRDGLGLALAQLSGRAPLEEVAARLRAVVAEVDELAADLRGLAETLADDPERLAEVRARRQLLRDLQRKYGDTVADVISFGDQARAQLAELESYEERAAALDRQRSEAEAALAKAEAALGKARRSAAPKLAAAVESHLRTLAMPRARFEVAVEGRAGEQVTFLLGANAGEPALPLSKVASGGELARAMLAIRLVSTEAGNPVLVFDEVDAGIGGEAALAVGGALAQLATSHQVLVVTHLPQVAAFADHQIAVSKDERDGRTLAIAEALDSGGRVVELSRMLSGQPDSATAREHAEELLASAAKSRSPRGGG
jgi:DNA repair protein RecN (Recombination protein N)